MMRKLTVVATMCGCLAACSRGSAPAETPVQRAAESRVQPATEAPVVLAIDGRSNAQVTLAADGDRVAATWVGSSDAGADVFAAVSEDGGRHFAAPVRVNDRAGDASANGEQPPRVVLRGPTMAVVWVSKREGVSGIRAAQSSDGGRTFAPSRTISPEGVTGARGWESADIAEDGTVHAAWLDGRHAQHAQPAPAASASAAHMHGGGPMRQDIVHAMWRGSDPVVETPVANDVCFCCKTGVVTHGRDVFVVWRHLFPGGVRDIAIAHSTDAGRTFGAPIRVSADNWKIDACPDDGPSLAIERDGAIRVAWPTLLQDTASPHMAIFQAVSRDGGATFSPRSRVDTSTTGASHPRVAVPAAGASAVVWDEPSARGRRVMIRRGDGPATVLTDVASASYPAMVAAGDGLVAAWTEQVSGRAIIRVVPAGRLRSN